MTLYLPHGFKRWGAFEDLAPASFGMGQEWRGQEAFQKHLLENGREREVGGFCAVCQRETRFRIRAEVGTEPNWRETLACEHCQLISRWRASVHLYALLGPTAPVGPAYMTEQTTPLFNWMEQHYPGLIGSEYLGTEAKPGEIREWHGRTLRHEDITALSMSDASLASVLTYDVIEHVPDYKAALREFARVLMPNGLLLLTAPFRLNHRDTIIRARIGSEGTIEHLLPEIYHGDPLSPKGVLCFQEFGWDLLDDLRAVGFSHVEIISCWAPQFGYIGELMPFIVARRYAPPPPTRWQRLIRGLRSKFTGGAG